MANLVAVDNKNHRTLQIDIRKLALHGAKLNMIPVVLSEFSSAATQYPLAITKDGETGEFVCIALLGFETGENLFWSNGEWQGLYLPLHIRRQPFFVGNPITHHKVQSDNIDHIVCVDSESPAITSEGGMNLFDERGLDSDYFQQTKACLAELLSGEAESKRLIENLQAMDLLQSLSLKITFKNQTSTRLNGLYTVNKEALAKLVDEQILQLHKLGLLAAIQILSNSLGQVQTLIDLKNNRLEH
ncbi:hypothetical protein NBRC116592_13220 [Colwellia sp. KU-HH00111]|uniref:SapC family protein n=1 Tax=Colwellia sp. KU-HH00111 TaxID=3127652 RepID=UPI0031022175